MSSNSYSHSRKMVQVDAILEPVADAVSQLIVFSADCEEQGIPMPDLTELSGMVLGATTPLVQVAMEMAQSSRDAKLKDALPQAASSVQGAAQRLDGFCQQLLATPNDSGARDGMVASCKVILDGMRELLEATNDSEVRRILKACQESAKFTKMVTQTAVESDFLSVAQHFSTASTTLVRLTNARLEELSHPELVTRLSAAVELVRTNAPLVISSHKSVLQTSGAAAIKTREFVVSDMAAAIQEIATVVQIRMSSISTVSAQDARMLNLASIQSNLRTCLAAALAGDAAALAAAQAQLDADFSELIARARAAAAACTDQALKTELLTLAKEVEAALTRTKAAQNALCADPDSSAKLAAARSAQAELERLAAALTGVVKDALLLQAKSALGAMPTELTSVFKAAQAADAAGFRSASMSMGGQSKLMLTGARQWSDYVEAQSIVTGITAVTRILERNLPQVVTAASTILQEPSNGPAKEHLAALTKGYQSQLVELEKYLVDDEALDARILALLDRIAGQFTVLSSNVAAGSATLQVLATTSLVTKHETLFDLAATYASGELEAGSREAGAVSDAIASIRPLLAPLQSQAGTAAAAPSDQAAARALGATISEIKFQNYTIECVVRGRDLPNQASAMASAREAAIAAMGGMLAAAALGDVPATMALLRQGDEAYRRQIALAREAASGMDSLLQRKAVLEACDALEADLEVLAPAAAAAAAAPGDAAAQTELARAVEACEADSAAIEHHLNNKPTEKEEVAELLDVAPRTLDAMEAAVRRGDAAEAQVAASDAAAQYQRIGELAQSIDVDDPSKAARAQVAAQNIATASQGLEAAAVAAASEPANTATQDTLGALTQALRYNAGVVDAALKRELQPEQEMAELRTAVEATYQAMQASAEAGQPATTAEYAKQIQDLNTRYAELGRQVAESKLGSNPAAHEAACAACTDLTAETSNAGPASAAAAADPSDAAKRDELATVVVAMRDAQDRIERALAMPAPQSAEAAFSAHQVRGANALDLMVEAAKEHQPKVAAQYAKQAKREYGGVLENARTRAAGADAVSKSVAEANIGEVEAALASLDEAHAAYQAAPDDAGAVAALEAAADQVKASTATLEATLNGEMNPQQEYANTVIHAEATMEQLARAVKAGDVAKADALAAVAEEQNRRLATLAQALAQEQDPQQAAIVNAACGRLNEQLDSMATVVTAAASDPNNIHAMDAFEAMVASIAAEKEKISSVLGDDGTGAVAAAAAGGAVMTAAYLATSGDNSPEAVAARAALIETLMGETDALLDDIKAAATAGKVQLTKVLTAQGEEKYDSLAALVEAQAGALDDPLAASIVAAKAAHIRPQMAAVTAAANATAADPESADKAETLDTSIRELQGTVASIDDGLKGKLDAQEIVATLVSSGATNLDALETAAGAGDSQQALARRKQAEKDYGQLLEAAASLESSLASQDAKDDYNDALETIKEQLGELKLVASRAAAAPGDEDAQDELADATHLIKHNANNVARILRGQEPLPDPLAPEEEEEELSQDPLMAAAQQVSRSANKWDASENEMVALAQQIGDLMAAMAEAQKAGDKKGLIEAARAINKLCAKIHTMAAEVHKTCGDPRLKRDLEVVMEMLPTIGVQLKIMSTVQASALAGDRPDPEALHSLIVCAQNLSNAVSQCISASQSASIKSMKTAVTVVAAALKWKKLRKKKR
ncbi:uncharacterized protein AMSG_10327 [Thecamonas trahens ATCC 50062]|uniref:Uncharacterized protein n=1 Tax=Thecamonas trahens ATCC 50062 TaxID=461836 RepID=A0A0L0DPW5_THETB|nr:hypothetical protein AMSG_10327 [Thecamonas trahens ATCC 50062]KNC54337.1 hypothetical protein AMSG_10327 [Thecamonas trahens ATCC 50062]|eukprot:XP_013753794.1 hypothetical protein AMSG_10327 [Thecamonas trahens ATCC 50062]